MASLKDLIVNGATRVVGPIYGKLDGKLNIGGQTYDGSSNVTINVTAGKTVTPSTSVQVAVPANTYVTGNINVAAMSGGTLAAAGSGAASKPSITFDINTGVATASVAASTGTAYANVSTAGYVTTSNNKSATFSITTSSNTNTFPAGALSASGSGAASSPNLTLYETNKTIVADVAASTGTAYAKVSTNGYVNTGKNTSATFSITKSSGSLTLTDTQLRNMVGAGTLAAAGSATQSKPGLSFNASNGVVTGSASAITATAYANVSSAGYVSTAKNTSATFSIAATSNTISIGLGSLSAGSGSAASTTKTVSSTEINADTYANTTYAIKTTGSGSVSVGTAGYIAKDTSKSSSTATKYYSINVQNKAATPSASAQNITPDTGYLLNQVEVGAVTLAIAKTVTGTTSRTAKAGGVGTAAKGVTITALANSDVYNNTTYAIKSTGNGNVYTGTGYISAGTTQSSDAVAYYSIDTETKTVDPSSSSQDITPNSGKLLSKVTVNAITAGAHTASGTGSATISSETIAYNSTSGVYAVTGSASISGTAYANVSTAGYISAQNTGSVSGTASLATTIAKTAIKANVTGTISRKPVIARTAITNNTTAGLYEGGNGGATTTVPTTGIYIKVASPANTATATASIDSVSAGYTDGKNHSLTNGTATAGAAASGNYYIPIKPGSASASGTGSATISSETFTYNSTAGSYAVTGSASISGTAVSSVTPGFVISGTNGSISGTASLSSTVAKAGITTSVSGSIARKPVIAVGSITNNTTAGLYNGAGGSATTTVPTTGIYIMVASPANTDLANSSVKLTAGYTDGNTSNTTISLGNKQAGAAASDNTYVPVKTGTITAAGTATVNKPSISVASNGLITATVAGITSSGTAHGYVNTAGWVTSSVTGNVTVTGNSATSQLSTQTATTITPSASSQTAVAAGKYTTGAVTVGAVTLAIARTVTGNVDIPDPTMSLSGNTITASGSWTAGYTTDTSYTNSMTLSPKATGSLSGTVLTVTYSLQ